MPSISLTAIAGPNKETAGTPNIVQGYRSGAVNFVRTVKVAMSIPG